MANSSSRPPFNCRSRLSASSSADRSTHPADALRRPSMPNWVIRLMPLRPALSPLQKTGTPVPSAETQPIPVTAAATMASSRSRCCRVGALLGVRSAPASEDEVAEPIERGEVPFGDVVLVGLDVVPIAHDRRQLDEADRVQTELRSELVLRLDLCGRDRHEEIVDQDLAKLVLKF